MIFKGSAGLRFSTRGLRLGVPETLSGLRVVMLRHYVPCHPHALEHVGSFPEAGAGQHSCSSRTQVRRAWTTAASSRMVLFGNIQLFCRECVTHVNME